MQTAKISVLYIHHYGKFGGASKSLFEVVSCFKDQINGFLISQKGLVPERFEKLGFQTISTQGISVIDHTVFGYYQGARWLVLARELVYLPYTIWAIYRAKKWEVDLIHINEISLLPAIIIAHNVIKKPIIVHARVVLHPKGIRYKLFQYILKRYCAHVIAIDKSVYNALPKVVPITIVHNGLKVPTNESNYNHSKTTTMKIGMIGGLIFMKGIFEFVEAAKILKAKNYSIKYIVVGESPTDFKSISGIISKALRLTRDIKKDIISFISKNELNDLVELRPFTLNVNDVYEEIDVLCFDNHANAAGRPVFEAAFHKKPSICSEFIDIKDGIIHMETGLCVESKDAHKLANAIEYFYLNRQEITRMGNNAYQHAIKYFDVEKNAKEVLSLYDKVLKENV
jgi:glycosyltransferase involved in cell wall biosynthesis